MSPNAFPCPLSSVPCLFPLPYPYPSVDTMPLFLTSDSHLPCLFPATGHCMSNNCSGGLSGESLITPSNNGNFTRFPLHTPGLTLASFLSPYRH